MPAYTSPTCLACSPPARPPRFHIQCSHKDWRTVLWGQWFQAEPRAAITHLQGLLWEIPGSLEERMHWPMGPQGSASKPGHWIPPPLTGSSAAQRPPQPGTQGPRQGKATAGPGPALGCLAWRKGRASHIKTSWPPTISGVSVPVTGSLSSLWGLWSPSPSPIFLEAF